MNQSRMDTTVGIFEALCNISRQELMGDPTAFTQDPKDLSKYDAKPHILAAHSLREIFAEDGKVGLLLSSKGLFDPFSQAYQTDKNEDGKKFLACMLNPSNIAPVVADFKSKVTSFLPSSEFNFRFGDGMVREFFTTLVTLGGLIIQTDKSQLLSRSEFFGEKALY